MCVCKYGINWKRHRCQGLFQNYLPKYFTDFDEVVLDRVRKKGLGKILHVQETYVIWAGDMKINLRKT
jgi:hypothetical protein